jgi:hypothetical protein
VYRTPGSIVDKIDLNALLLSSSTESLAASIDIGMSLFGQKPTGACRYRVTLF